jgi:hypothetical protein
LERALPLDLLLDLVLKLLLKRDAGSARCHQIRATRAHQTHAAVAETTNVLGSLEGLDVGVRHAVATLKCLAFGDIAIEIGFEGVAPRFAHGHSPLKAEGAGKALSLPPLDNQKIRAKITLRASM